MWDIRANSEGELIFEIRDEEGQIVTLITLTDLQSDEKLFIEMFKGERRQS